MTSTMFQIRNLFQHLVNTLCGIIFLGCIASAAGPSAKGQPNILWIVGENLKLDLGCYGAKNVKTPALDGLAASGMRYTHVFSTSPVCAPSRSAFFVGMYQTTTDTHNMRSHRSDNYRLPKGVRPLTHHLKDVGYFTANIKTIGDDEVGSGKLDMNFVNEGKLYDTSKWEDLKQNQPFFAQVNTLEAEYDIYDRQTWKQPRVEWKGEQHHEQIATEDNVTPPPYYPDHPLVRKEWARYLNSISGMDKTIGRILAQLKEDGLADNTIIVFFGDNGRIEPRGIHWCYDTGLHVPMIVHCPKTIRAPGNYKQNTVSDQVISLIDLMPTTLGFAGIDRPLGMQGRVFLGNKDKLSPPRRYAFSARDRIDETVNRIRSVRGKRYHYLRNYYPDQHFTSLNRYKEKCFPIKPLMREMMAAGKLTGPPADLMSPRVAPEQLFDTVNDPHEINNLADSTKPEHQAALLRMREALDLWIVETQDRGEFPESDRVVKPFEKEMHDWFGTPDWYTKQISLFDGKSLDGWSSQVNGDVKAVDGEIQILAKGKNLWLSHSEVLNDFELTVEAKMPSDDYNSGIGFRCQAGDKKIKGYQCEIARDQSGMIYAIGSGWVWPKDSDARDSYAKKAGLAFDNSKWNKFRVRCEGDHIQVWINGNQVVDVHDNRFQRGSIALQHHGKGGLHRFRNVKVQRLMP